jgi:hypothetical protein
MEQTYNSYNQTVRQKKLAEKALIDKKKTEAEVKKAIDAPRVNALANLKPSIKILNYFHNEVETN